MVFGFFASDMDKVRKLRLQFEDIRQRILFKMNPYEQYSFGSTYLQLFDEIEGMINNLPSGPCAERTQFAKELKRQAEQAWNAGSRGNTLSGEGQRAGANALALHAISVEVDSYQVAEARTLRADIDSFRSTAEQMNSTYLIGCITS